MSHTNKSTGGLLDKASKSAGGMLNKASEVMGEMATDDVMASAIVRADQKQERVNKLLKEKGCDHRVKGFEIDNHVPPGMVFYVTEGRSKSRR